MAKTQEQALQKLRERGYDGVADKIAEGLQRWDDGLVGSAGPPSGNAIVRNALKYDLRLRFGSLRPVLYRIGTASTFSSRSEGSPP
jgi:hypothetical protein